MITALEDALHKEPANATPSAEQDTSWNHTFASVSSVRIFLTINLTATFRCCMHCEVKATITTTSMPYLKKGPLCFYRYML